MSRLLLNAYSLLIEASRGALFRGIRLVLDGRHIGVGEVEVLGNR